MVVVLLFSGSFNLLASCSLHPPASCRVQVRQSARLCKYWAGAARLLRVAVYDVGGDLKDVGRLEWARISPL